MSQSKIFIYLSKHFNTKASNSYRAAGNESTLFVDIKLIVLKLMKRWITWVTKAVTLTFFMVGGDTTPHKKMFFFQL